LLQHNDHTHPELYSRVEERLPMGCSGSTLLDILTSEQFQIVILLSVGLDTFQIADLLETNDWTVCSSLSDSLDRTGCLTEEGLTVRLIFEYENNPYAERLEKELAALQNAAKRMLGNVTYTLSAAVESSEHPCGRWVM
jgi:DNA-binding NarL/FixJ family response regulator